MSAQVLSFFWELAALNVDRRVKAAASLITALRTAQAEFEDGSSGALSPDLVYAVRRLVRGLASPRDGARQGFGAALIEVLGAFDEVTPEEVLEQVTSSQCLSRTHHEHCPLC
jgi:DNA polymerase phi